MIRKVNIAVIGTGRMGSVHVANLVRQVPLANLSAICDIRLDVAQKVADDLGIERVVQDYHDLLADKDIEAVLIATSTDTHAKIVEDCACAGKQIFCEKPLAPTLAEIEGVLKVIAETGVKLQVGFNRRFDKNFQKVKEVVQSGALGRPCILRITNRDPELPSMAFLRLSGGMFMDMSIHDFDMARFQIGEVDEIYAIGDVFIDPELKSFGDMDTTVISLRFKDGTLGTIDNSRQAVYGYDQRLEVLCLDGVAKAENEFENSVSTGNPSGFHSAPAKHFFMERYAPCYVEEVRQFIDAVRENLPTPTNGMDGYMAVAIAMAAAKSVQEKRPVKMSEIINI